MRKLLAIALLLACPSAFAAQDTTRVSTINEILTGIALNATEADRTMTVCHGRNWSKLKVGVDYTNSSATTVTAAPECSYDGTTYFAFTTLSCGSGTCSRFERTDSNAVSGDDEFEFEFDVRGCECTKIVFGGASADGSDLVTTQSVVVVGE